MECISSTRCSALPRDSGSSLYAISMMPSTFCNQSLKMNKMKFVSVVAAAFAFCAAAFLFTSCVATDPDEPTDNYYSYGLSQVVDQTGNAAANSSAILNIYAAAMNASSSPFMLTGKPSVCDAQVKSECQSAETAIKEAVKAGKFGHYVFEVTRIDVSSGSANTIIVYSYTVN